MDKEGAAMPARITFMKGLSRSLIVIGIALVLFGVGSFVSFLERDQSKELDAGGEGDPRGYIEWQRDGRFFFSGAIALSIGLYLRSRSRENQVRSVGPDFGNPR
jgi:hypothetical protein